MEAAISATLVGSDKTLTHFPCSSFCITKNHHHHEYLESLNSKCHQFTYLSQLPYFMQGGGKRKIKRGLHTRSVCFYQRFAFIWFSVSPCIS